MKFPAVLIFLILPGLLMFSDAAYAQNQHGIQISSNDLQRITQSNRAPVYRASNTIGSPYLHEEFHSGTVSLSDGRVVEDLPIRYNIHQQHLEYRTGSIPYVISPEMIDTFEFEFENRSYRFEKGYSGDTVSEEEFVQILAKGEIIFFVKHSVNYQEDVASYGTATKQNRFLSSENYFFQRGSEEPERVRRFRQRNVMSYISQHQDKVLAFAGEKNINFRDPDDTARLMNFYNSLFEEI